MLPEHVREKKSALVPAPTLIMPAPIGEATIRGRTKKETLARVEKLTRRGYVHSASAIGQFHQRAGGGYGVKVRLLKPLPQPIPGWAKGLALVGAALTALALAAALLVKALADLFGVMVAIPWSLVAGAAFLFLLAAFAVKRFVFGGVTINQTVNFK